MSKPLKHRLSCYVIGIILCGWWEDTCHPSPTRETFGYSKLIDVSLETLPRNKRAGFADEEWLGCGVSGRAGHYGCRVKYTVYE